MFKIRLIVSLNNPREYFDTRHNVGAWWISRFLASNFIDVNTFSNFSSYIGKIKFFNVELYLLEPIAYMNNNGPVILKFCNYHNINFSEVLVLHDDLDLLPGIIKLKCDGNSAGHKGLNSLVFSFKTDKFKRIRIGIGRPKFGSINEYVLSKPTDLDKKSIVNVINASFLCIDDIINLNWNRVSSKLGLIL